MQLLMRRPEVEGFISIAPQPNIYDFSFLAPCPSSGLIIHGDADKVAPQKDVQGLVDKLHTQKGITITQTIMPGANHFFSGQEDAADRECSDYLGKWKVSQNRSEADRIGVAEGLAERQENPEYGGSTRWERTTHQRAAP
jgi:alpha/beta superfamily hydrolase